MEATSDENSCGEGDTFHYFWEVMRQYSHFIDTWKYFCVDLEYIDDECPLY